MLNPVPMTRLRLIILERDERAVLHHLDIAGVIQLARSTAGPETAPLPPRDHSDQLAKLERISSRLDHLRRLLELPFAADGSKVIELRMETAERILSGIEERAGQLLKNRQRLQHRLSELATVNEKIKDYSEVVLPLDEPAVFSFVHLVMGSVPAKNLEKIDFEGTGFMVPLTKHDGRQFLIAMATRDNKTRFDQILQQADFRPDTLPVVAGSTSEELIRKNQNEQETILQELNIFNSQLKSLAKEFEPNLPQIQKLITLERNMLEAEQYFPRTESSVFITGWVPASEMPGLERCIREITHGRYALEATPAEKLPEAEVPVLLRHPRILRPFALLVTAYGLPKYQELEPTLFVAISYLVMFGMMFGDTGHGLVLAAIGVILLLSRKGETIRQAGLLLSFAGSSSITSGIIYGSYFGIERFKQFALWHDPLAGNPSSLMAVAVGIGIAMISLGLMLNTLNHLRHGRFADALLDKFALAGLVFYWSALAVALKPAAIAAMGFSTPVICSLLALPVIGWMVKEPLGIWRRHGRLPSTDYNIASVAVETGVNVFEAFLSYFANTVSFVRLAAYAMSHAAILMATYMIAENLKHLSYGGTALSILVIIFGNAVAIALEGIVASVQALRLEYYEFFGKFFSGAGQPFEPFHLYKTRIAELPH